LQIKTKIVSFHTADSKPVKQEVNGTMILPPLVFPGQPILFVPSVSVADHVPRSPVRFPALSARNGPSCTWPSFCRWPRWPPRWAAPGCRWSGGGWTWLLCKKN